MKLLMSVLQLLPSVLYIIRFLRNIRLDNIACTKLFFVILRDSIIFLEIRYNFYEWNKSIQKCRHIRHYID